MSSPLAPSSCTAAGDRLIRYAWTGNDRELMNSIEGAVTLPDYELHATNDLPPRVASAQVSAVWEFPHALIDVEEIANFSVNGVMNCPARKPSSGQG